MANKFITLLVALTIWSCASPDENRIQLILDWKAQMEHAGFFVADQKGFYAEEGLEVEILEGNGAPTAARVVGNGTYKLGIASGSATVMARSRNIPIVSLAVINQHTPVVVYSLKEKNITKPDDLIGKRIGVNVGGTKHREFQALLRKHNISEDQIQLMGMSEASPAPLLAGQVDAMLGYTEDQPVMVELLGKEVNRLSLADYGIDVYSTNIIVNESFLKENPDRVRRFMRATLRGWRYAVAHPDEAVAAYMAKRPESNEAFNRENFKHLIPLLNSPDTEQQGLGAQTEEKWKYTRDILHSLGMIDHNVDIDQLFTNTYLSK
jgi:ABC-type nitrate/sulfonate/bicarbonate transport system substrate-binding protein